MTLHKCVRGKEAWLIRSFQGVSSRPTCEALVLWFEQTDPLSGSLIDKVHTKVF